MIASFISRYNATHFHMFFYHLDIVLAWVSVACFVISAILSWRQYPLCEKSRNGWLALGAALGMLSAICFFNIT